MGQDRGFVPAGGSSWEHDLYAKVLGSVTDQKITAPGPAPKGNPDRSNADYGFQNAIQHQDEYSQGLNPDPLPPAGPVRARAALVGLAKARPTRRGAVSVAIACPPKWPAPGAHGCIGKAKLEGSKGSFSYSLAPGARRVYRPVLKRGVLRKLRRTRSMELDFVVVNRDSAGGTVTKSAVTLRSPF